MTDAEHRQPGRLSEHEADLPRGAGRGSSWLPILPQGRFGQPVTGPDGHHYVLVPARTGTTGRSYDRTAPEAALVLPVLWLVDRIGWTLHGQGWTVWLEDVDGQKVARRRYRGHDEATTDLPRLTEAVTARGPQGMA